MSYPVPSTNSGYVCPKCGIWVEIGQGHTCGIYPPQPQYVYNDTYYLQQIINLLEKILKKLEE